MLVARKSKLDVRAPLGAKCFAIRLTYVAPTELLTGLINFSTDISPLRGLK